jgi:hypothetical protein
MTDLELNPQADLEFVTSLGIDPYQVMIGTLKSLRDAHLDEHSFEHDHWTDDCGDYANAALRLAAEIQGGYLNATELGVAGVLMELASPDQGGSEFSTLFGNYACDGIPRVLEDAVRLICKAKGWTYDGEDDEDEPEASPTEPGFSVRWSREDGGVVVNIDKYGVPLVGLHFYPAGGSVRVFTWPDGERYVSSTMPTAHSGLHPITTDVTQYIPEQYAD